jgi:hypothetical protein
MKTLTIKQPWAALIVHGIKDIENRTWPTKFRGRILIHAGASSVGSLHEVTTAAQKVSFCDQAMGSMKAFDCQNLSDARSAIIGSVEIVDCVENHPSVWAENNEDLPVDGEIIKPIYNWVLANPILFDNPILDVKGRLSLWEYSGNVPDPC